MEPEQDVSMTDTVSSSILHFDPFGDRKIIAGSEEKPEIFLVSSQAMSLTSRQWRAMFAADSPFATAPSSPNSVVEIPMPDDDANALRVLLSVIHLKFGLLPKLLAYDDLVKLAIVCDKYDVAEVVQPWITDWINNHKVLESLEDRSRIANTEGWLFVAWTFGLISIFERVSAVLIKNIALSEDYTITISGHVVKSDYMPPGVLGTSPLLKKSTLVLTRYR